MPPVYGSSAGQRSEYSRLPVGSILALREAGEEVQRRIQGHEIQYAKEKERLIEID